MSPQYPSWYTPDPDGQPPGAYTPPLVTVTPMRSPRPASGLPDWYTPDPDGQGQASTAAAPPTGAANTAPPSWYTPDPDAPKAPPPAAPTDWSAAKNFLTGLARVPGAIVGAPVAVGHAVDWAANAVSNAVHGTDTSTADYIAQSDPSQAGMEKAAQFVSDLPFKLTGTTPYEPTTAAGQLGQAAVTGLGAGFVDPAADASLLTKAPTVGRALAGFFKAVAKRAPEAGKVALSSAAANGAQQLAPDSDVLPVVAAIVAHNGAGLAGSLATGGASLGADVVRQVVAPANQGVREAARTLRAVPNDAGAMLAQPSDAELAGALSSVQGATRDIGPGLEPWQAGASLRDTLQGRANALKAQRSKVADAAYDTFREEQPLGGEKLAPFMRSPSFQKAVKGAAASVLDEGNSPLTDYWDFNEAGDPISVKNAGVPTDVLDRIKRQLDDQVSGAAPGSGAQRTASILRNRFVDMLDQEYPNTYPQTRETYAEASRPLDPLTSGTVGKVLDASPSFGGTPDYKLADERVPDAFLRSNATRSDLNQLVDAMGGDKPAALSALEQHLAGRAQAAMNPDGTLNADAYERSMAPYNKSLGKVSVWFPQLAQKFATAKAAQNTLDLINTQRGLADAIDGGALRDADGAVTGQSVWRWLRANMDALAKTQTPAAVMRLQTIANALKSARPGDLAEAIRSEVVPAAAGSMFGGLEGGVLGTLLHKTTQAAFGGLDARRAGAFNAAIERAALDPEYAAQITAAMGKARGVSPVRALVRSIVASPVAITSAVDAGARGQ